MKVTKFFVLRLIIACLGLIFVNTAASESDLSSVLTKIENGKITRVFNVENRTAFDQVLFETQPFLMTKNPEKSEGIFSGKAIFGNGVEILVTGYSSTVDQCDGDPFTMANGNRVYWGAMACPPQYPFGTKIKINGVGEFTCEDRGGKIKGNHFDMWFETRIQALQWGKRSVLAEIIQK